MRVIGIQVPPAVTGGEATFFPVGQLTVLFGANDTGKTRLLRAIDAGLGVRDLNQPGAWAIGDVPSLHLDLGGPPARWADEVLDIARVQDIPGLRHDLAVFGQIAVDLWSDAGDELRFDATMSSPKGALDYYEWVLRGISGLANERWDPLFATLRESPYAVARPAISSKFAGWALDWCLPPDASRDATTLALLADLDIFPSGLVAQPLPVAPLVPWVTDGRGLPEVLMIPTATGQLEATVRDAGLRAVASLGALRPDCQRRFVVATLKACVESRLPDFVTERYEVRAIADDGVEICFALRDSGVVLRPSEMADGYRLWIELALRDAASVVWRGCEQLAGIALLEATPPDPRPDTRDAYSWLQRVKQDLVDAIEPDPEAAALVITPMLAELAADRSAALAWSYAGRAKPAGLSAAAGSRSHAPPLVLIDEPERHLHPSLQRTAASYLARVAADANMHLQMMLVTHSVAMLTVGDSASYAQVSRDAGSTVVSPFTPRDDAALRRLGDDLGLDRGELLTIYRVIVFVEGYVDEIVLETLFGERLRLAGIKLVPMHGTNRMAAVPEADLLFDLLRQRIAVIVDGVVAERMPQQSDLARWEALADDRATRPDELRKLAQLKVVAARRGRDIRAFSIGGPDVIAELDEAILCEVQQLGYPGHARTYERWSDALAHDPNASWKGVCVKTGHLDPSPDAIAPVVLLMRHRDVSPSENLSRVVAHLEALAAEAR